MESLIIPKDSNLSLNEIGLLSTMLNIPDCDYATLEKLCSITGDTALEIEETLTSLQKQNYVIVVAGKYAINKHRLTNVMFYGGEK